MMGKNVNAMHTLHTRTQSWSDFVISGKVYMRAKEIIRDRYYLIMEELIPQEYITTLNVYAPISWRDLNIISQLGN